MRVILPMDIAYATIYLLYNALTVLIRSYKVEISTVNYVFYYNIINMVSVANLKKKKKNCWTRNFY